MHVTFLGAAETVTGSRFLVETGSSRVLVDCGLFQGVKRLRRQNWEPFPVDPPSVDAVVLTHAHIDHSGYLPRFVRDGFDGPIHCTRSTAALAEIMLLDSAHIHEEDARYANKRGSSKHHPALPLYTTEDAEVAIGRLEPHDWDDVVDAGPGVEARFSPSGHILGAASVRVSDGARSVLVSGDLGRRDDWVMHPPAAPLAADHIVVESTYGNRYHSDEDPRDVLAEVVTETAARGGTVLIPVFAVGRAQTVLHLLAQLRKEGRIPEVPTFLNSPMAVDVTELFVESDSDHRLTRAEIDELCASAELVRSVEDSKRLTARRGPLVVLAASGMLSGGRVLHHLFEVAPDRNSTILLAGFQAAGTRGESLLNGARSLRVFGEDVPVRADVVTLDTLSAHGDSDDLLAWLRASPQPPSSVSVVHGEAGAADALRRRVEHELGWPADVPAFGATVTF
ncbi:MAG: MBL fold metallo-hydrolase [Acidimicrobiales bacterium]|nr:MBL fold metallo-hydrolase [Acidimicrobiales bacterium]